MKRFMYRIYWRFFCRYFPELILKTISDEIPAGISRSISEEISRRTLAGIPIGFCGGLDRVPEEIPGQSLENYREESLE